MSASTHSVHNVFFAFVGCNDASYIERAVGVSTAVIVILHIFFTGNHLCKGCIKTIQLWPGLTTIQEATLRSSGGLAWNIITTIVITSN